MSWKWGDVNIPAEESWVDREQYTCRFHPSVSQSLPVHAWDWERDFKFSIELQF